MARNPSPLTLTQPLDPCECGCGGTTATRFINGHQNRRREPWYAVEDCGYDTPCWVWLAARNQYGYGLKRHAGRSQLAHRVMYAEATGDWPRELDHLCRNRACVNPAHLESVTRATNSRRGVRTKLTAEKAAEIRESSETYKALAARFGVSTSAVWSIRAGKNWSARAA